MDTEKQPTCGQGLAENSALPARLSDLVTSMSRNLEVHMRALDLTDANAKVEYDAYEKLVRLLKNTAGALRAVANEMSGHRDLPMGRHDRAAMTHPRVREAFEQFILQKQELLSLLQETSERDAQLLETMRSHGQ